MSITTLETLSEYIEKQRGEMLERNSFYDRLPAMKTPQDFRWCNSLYHLSKEFANLLKLRYEHFQDVPHEVFISHYEEEKDHAEMLRKWMLDNGLDDPENHLPTPETDAFISLQYRASVGFDQNFSLISINSVGEGTAFDFYYQVHRHLQKQAGFASTDYWAVHCEADEEHSNVFHLLSEMTPEEIEKARHYAEYTFSVVNEMIESWK